MAKIFIPFEVSLSGSGGSDNISINDPTFGQQDDLNNQRIKMMYNQQGPLTLEQQRLLQTLQNTGATGIYPNNLIVNPDPTVTPFPIGCPSGFFQEGNVCVPIIGTYPDENTNAPPAGHNFARGIIDDVDGPGVTKAGETFEVRVFVRNNGAIRGKFQVALIVPLWNLDVVSDSGWIPQYTPAIITVRGTVPAGATLGIGTIPSTVELQGLDEVTRDFTVHDVSSLNLPQPQIVGTPTGTCFTQGGVQYCESPTGSTALGCIQIGTKWYCPPPVVPPQCFTFNGVQYCATTTPTGSGCLQIGTQFFCPVTTTPNCFTFNQLTYCESDEITGPNCVQIGNKIYCPTTPPTTPNCTTIGGAEFCKSDTWRPGCIIYNNLIYCPEEEEEEPPVNVPAVIFTEPANSQRDGDNFKVKGSNFAPGEIVDVLLSLIWQQNCGGGGGHHGYRASTRSNFVRVKSYYGTYYKAYTGSRDDDDDDDDDDDHCWNGRPYNKTVTVQASSTGTFSIYMKTQEVPSGVSSTANIKAKGRTSHKEATTTIDIT